MDERFRRLEAHLLTMRRNQVEIGARILTRLDQLHGLGEDKELLHRIYLEQIEARDASNAESAREILDQELPRPE